jgi:hypothetical protein
MRDSHRIARCIPALALFFTIAWTAFPEEDTRVVLAEPGGVPEQVLALYNKFMDHRGNLPTAGRGRLSEADLKTATELMRTLYVPAESSGDAHGTVALLIKQGLESDSLSEDFKAKYKRTQIGEDASRLMASAREQMIEATILDVLGKRKDLHVARSDTGNPDSGMRSDLDQTFFVFRVDTTTGARSRAPDMDQAFLQDFHSVWKTRYGDLTLRMLDVVSMKGSARFPDPRYVSVDSFASAYHKAAGDLRNLEGAYTSPEAITQQVHQRQHEALMALQDGSVPNPDDPPRMWQEYGRADDGQVGKIGRPDYDVAVREMLGGSPELAPHASFSAAIANWMMLRHSIHGTDFNVKYHLRTFDDSVYVKLLMESGGGMQHKAEYAKMTPEERALISREALGRLFPDDVQKQKLHKAAMDVSADLRNRHANTGGGRPEPSRPELAGADDKTIYDPLLREMFGDRYTPKADTPQARTRLQSQLEAAKACHQRLASEFCIRSAQVSAPDAFRAMRDGGFCDQVRPFFETEGRQWDEIRANLMEGARLTLLYGIHDLGMVEGARVVRQMDLELPGKRWDLAGLYLDAQFMPFRAYRANPKAYHEAFKARLADLVAGARSYTLGQWGFEKVADFEAGSTVLKGQKLVWCKYKLLKNMFDDIGTAASLAAVAETFVVSKGDMKQVVLKVLDEVFLAIPVVGQLENVRRGGMESAALMGAVLLFPPAGKVLVAYNIGNSMYIIADAEYLAPARNNAADAVYRGFAGPETRAYGEPGDPPPVWHDGMQEEWQGKKDRFAAAQDKLKTHEQAKFPPETPPEVLARHKVALAQAKIDLTAAQTEWEEVEKIRLAFDRLAHGHWAGGYFTEGGAVKQQLWIHEPLIEPIEPLYGFVTSGVVDLRVDYVPERDEPEIRRLSMDAKSGKTVAEQVRAAAQLAELRLRKERYERAQRYKAKFDKQPELLVRFRQDSVYANIQEKRINMDEMVREYFAKHDKRLYEKLLEENLISPAPVQKVRVGNDPLPIDSDILKVVPGQVKNLVREHLQADYERSRRLLAAYKRAEQHRVQEQEKEIEKAVLLFQNQAFAKAVKPFSNDKDFLKFLSALRFVAVKRKAPSVQMTFFKIFSTGPEQRNGKEGTALREPFRVDLQANTEVDPSLHQPPYTTAILVLTEEEARNPPEKIGGLPLLPETLAAIKSAAKPDHVVAVGSVSCSRVAPLEGALAKTLDGLPGYANGKAAAGPVVLHQAVKAIPAKLLTVPVDPIRVQVVDAAGHPIVGVQDLVRVGDEPATVSKGEYWGKHTFTKYGEEVPITATYNLPTDRTLTGSAALSVNDIADWLKPAGPAEPIQIRLPILMPSSVSVRGHIQVEELPNTKSVSRTATLRCGGLGVETQVEFPVGRSAGSYDVKPRHPLLPGETIHLEATAGGTIQMPQGEGPAATRSVTYSGKLAVAIPAQGGVVDAGTLKLRADSRTTTVPLFDARNPPPAKEYLARVREAGLVPKPNIAGPPTEDRFAHCVQDTLPKPGTAVLPGTDVAVMLFGASEFTVPDVVGLPLQDATRILEKKQIRPNPNIGGPPPNAEQAFRVVSQGVKAGTPYKPGLELSLVTYGRATPAVQTVVVPDLSGMTVAQAVQALQAVDLKLKPSDERPPAPDLRSEGTIGKQAPLKGARVPAGQEVAALVYGKFERGGEADPVADLTGPFFVVFGLSFPQLKESQGIPPAPKKQQDETREAFAVRLRRYLDGISYKALNFALLPAEKVALPFYIAGPGLQKYPRRLFTPDAKFAATVDVTRLTPKPNQPGRVHGVLLLQVLRVCNTREEVLAAYPAIKANQNLNALAFQTADGICSFSNEEQRGGLGPLRSGWTDADKEACWNMLKDVYVALGAISCFVATVSYPDLDAPRFKELRSFRDRVLLKSSGGRRLVDLYYRHGPGLAATVLQRDWQVPARCLLDRVSQICARIEPSDPLAWMAIEAAGLVAPVIEPMLWEKETDPALLPVEVLIHTMKESD